MLHFFAGFFFPDRMILPYFLSLRMSVVLTGENMEKRNLKTKKRRVLPSASSDHVLPRDGGRLVTWLFFSIHSEEEAADRPSSSAFWNINQLLQMGVN